MFAIMATIPIVFTTTALADATSNNIRPKSTATSIDYTVDALTATTRLSVGDVIKASDIVCQNQFDAPRGAAYAALYASTDATITADDIRISTHRINTSPGKCSSGQYWGFMPFGSVGTYFLGSIADYRDDVIEDNEYNNVSPIQTIEIIEGQADITVEMTSSPQQAMPGQSITVSSVICNNGTKSTDDFLSALYLSDDPIIDLKDTLLGSVKRIIYNEHCTGPDSVTLSGTLPDDLIVGGRYYLGLIADIDNDVIESDEDNNRTVGVPITIITPVDDLAFSSLQGPTVGTTGMSVQVKATLCNLTSDNVPFQFGDLYLSKNNVITTSDIKIIVGSHYNFTANTPCTTDIFTSAKIPDSLATGTYYWGAIADSLNWVQELDENNNAITGNAIIIQ